MGMEGFSMTVNPNTFKVAVNERESCDIPDAFGDNLRSLVASLDWSRVWNTQQNHDLTAAELKNAARYARELADQCEAFAADGVLQ